MKITKVQNTSTASNYALKARNLAGAKPSFKGNSTDIVIGAFDAVSRGGFVALFLLQDLFGTNIPRMWQSWQRNKEETGKYNYPALAETTIREFTTGSMMFAVPLAIISGASRMLGSAVKAPIQDISDMTEIMKETLGSAPELKGNKAELKKAFYENAFKNISQNTFDTPQSKEELDEFAKKFARYALEYEDKNTPKRNFWQMLMDKKLVDQNGNAILAKDELLDKSVHEYSIYKKKHMNNYGVDFTTVKAAKGSAEVPFDSFVKRMKDIADDAISTIGKSSREVNLERFKNIRVGARFVNNIFIFIMTGLALSLIPKLYSLSKESPETGEIHKKARQLREGGSNANI